MNQSICAGDQANVSATLGGTATSIIWTSSGTGAFANPTVPTTTYTPSINDIAQGFVYLIAQTNDPDGSGPCSTTIDSVLLTINELPIISNIQTTPVTDCNAPNGTITINATSSFTPIEYSINNGTNFSTTNYYSGLNAGIYSIVVKNAVGCTASQSVTIQNTQGPQITSIEAIDPLCFGQSNGQIVVHATGADYYILNGGTQTTDSVFSNLGSGTYSIMVIDNGNCQAISQVTLNQPTELMVSHTQSGILCNGENTGFIHLNVMGGTPPYTYLWSNGSITSDIQNIGSGTYTYTISDANQCIQTQSIDIVGSTVILPSIVFDATTQQAEVNVVGGTLPYSYLWSNGITDTIITLTETGLYTVTITDVNGCTAIASYNYDVPLKIPTCITPNGDKVNDDFEITNIAAYPKLTIKIYNRWGNLIYSFDGTGIEYTSASKRWDGKYNGKDLPMGPYLYIIDLHNNKEPITGTITIIR